MRNPQVVLDSLASKSKDESYGYERLYRNLYNPEFYLGAYATIYANPGNMTRGADGETIDGMSIDRIKKLIDQLKDESYQPTPVRRTYIPKKKGGERPLGIPSFDDKLVQCAVKVILESIYEGNFFDESHGYRPNRSCHTALKHVVDRFNGTRWFVEGDIKGFFDNIDHHIMINLLRKRIKDEKFTRLIWKFLRAGYLEDWRYGNTYSGTPQGGIISPILANIYLTEMDKYILDLKKKFDKGKERAKNKEYESIRSRENYFKGKLNGKHGALKEGQRESIIAKLKESRKYRLTLPSTDQMDPNYRRMQYVRYADDFIIGVIGSKEDVMRIKEKLAKFLNDELKLELSKEKTLITHGTKKARFLGYNICISNVENQTKVENKEGKKYTMRSISGKVRLEMPKEAWVSKLVELKAIKMDGNVWKPMHRPFLINLDDLEILSTYNAQIRGMYEYYKLAINCSGLNKFKYFMEYSMYKTFANKYKSTIGKIKGKYCKNGIFTVRYETKKGQKERAFYNEGFKRDATVGKNHMTVDIEADTNKYVLARTSLISRLLSSTCEWCGATGVPVEIHHVRKLKDLKGKKMWELAMIARNRKTMALCANGHGNECHKRLHAGLLD
ncbi:reverse transcriptase/maturase family protein [Bacillus salipaludis]|uniref:reverse transcriptase/maturase family protein n=1 Tax=Bacillus salipaludis TaxID=2547811 RepID=UPI002E1DB7DD|nr:reverse transcriptase domain-containing protein [Bacillus salipaludis]